uniref:Uncharacterized protein n=1 Tax=Avena sativa TaxID=4498 RepID=A0ACD5UZ65_AVESA
MVSWSDGEESSHYATSSDDGGASALQVWICGCQICSMGGCNTGRRYLACEGQEGEKCLYVHWVDPVWPDALMKAMGKLWKMFAEAKQGRVNDALDYVEKKFDFGDQIKKLNQDVKKAQDEVEKEVKEKQVTLSLKAKAKQALMAAGAEIQEKITTGATIVNMHKYLLVKAEKDRDKYMEKKRKLQCIVSYLLKEKKSYRVKFRKIKEIVEM